MGGIVGTGTSGVIVQSRPTIIAVFGKAVANESDLRALPAKGFFKQTADITMTTGDFLE